MSYIFLGKSGEALCPIRARSASLPYLPPFILVHTSFLLVSLTYSFDSLQPFSVYVSIHIQLVYVFRKIILGYAALNHYVVN